MSNAASRRGLDLGGLIGETENAARARLGAPITDRVMGGDRWMIFEGAGWSLRLRGSRDSAGDLWLVRSWTVTLEEGPPTLDAACAVLGLSVEEVDAHGLRLPLLCPRSGVVHSLTATRRAGRIRSVTGFDEPPDWGREDEAK